MSTFKYCGCSYHDCDRHHLDVPLTTAECKALIVLDMKDVEVYRPIYWCSEACRDSDHYEDYLSNDELRVVMSTLHMDVPKGQRLTKVHLAEMVGRRLVSDLLCSTNNVISQFYSTTLTFEPSLPRKIGAYQYTSSLINKFNKIKLDIHRQVNIIVEANGVLQDLGHHIGNVHIANVNHTILMRPGSDRYTAEELGGVFIVDAIPGYCSTKYYLDAKQRYEERSLFE